MTTTSETILTELILHNNWANQQVIAACMDLSEDQLAATLPGSYGTIRRTLEHLVDSEGFYIELLTGNRPRPSFDWKADPSIVEIKDFDAQVGQALIATISQVQPADLIQHDDEGQLLQYKALAVYIQIINHGIEHRTNITSILSAEQHATPKVSGWGYLDAFPERFDYVES